MPSTRLGNSETPSPFPVYTYFWKVFSLKGVTGAELLHLQRVQQIGATWPMDGGNLWHRLFLLPPSSLVIGTRKVCFGMQALSLFTLQVNKKRLKMSNLGCHGSKIKISSIKSVYTSWTRRRGSWKESCRICISFPLMFFFTSSCTS